MPMPDDRSSRIAKMTRDQKDYGAWVIYESVRNPGTLAWDELTSLQREIFRKAWKLAVRFTCETAKEASYEKAAAIMAAREATSLRQVGGSARRRFRFTSLDIVNGFLNNLAAGTDDTDNTILMLKREELRHEIDYVIHPRALGENADWDLTQQAKRDIEKFGGPQ